ncbi:uncharacterized protein FOMMEDRAFT_16425 [Fomitiporia mediterranea MF3/22]|uniref:uncharacterized protein n=1 Tax=Fomitiporia mediterranea (strain MF3/22) TaxID=694068 RepID=UPI00044077D0|nr:uncharacterized protein FOMMEDRAFT_16425 [Fomitiporia mediterranea MF3/22]EJD07817.1 hypothetical protein FOMMEDRAFT_16425 [Fomitiporia mediterranea MF3/22]
MSRAFVPASVEGAMLKEYKPVFIVGTIDEAKDRLNASEGEKYKAILGADLDTEVTRLEECLRDVKRQREEARTMKANTKPVKVRLKQSTKLSKIIKQVLDWMMDSVVTLTHYKLFAIAPELECYVVCKDDKAQSSLAAELRTSRLCGKVVDYVRLSQIQAREQEQDNNKAGSVLVRLATVKLNNKLETESLLDQGAVMNVMCKDVWKHLGVPKEQVWTNLRLANVGSITIKGVILRLKVSVGGILIVMLVHVVKDTMFNMIIGRLFFVLTECETKDFKDSNQILTLTDSADQNWKCQVET